ncbi:MAG: DUF2795 domain-containing protein [Candidatus Margulisiibacteriota bacterium]|nr:MAG: hypothetical protein A2X43_01840 [Candidatus Margulisbacteria bacterium GWD2_39_127]OGI05398.1 MAG: hypothetical protein A2X42_08470 [Candidatus Margulisbacteria bacterium GWF2_38_17]OGI05934.1 MAG: hypothetical protein A2X41_07620 [Candidatus Margulisbacteria bacterium GWE2_39_32]PZM79384.1 MAG: DUF2795 domain-containing protein [Candidatus Margulisiibacteriota bacterium]HAR63566.1 hypothetical protein [Candidatus Margulisiibacteriota bacterium]
MVSTAMVEKALAGIDYPADKSKMLQFAKERNASSEVLDVLNRMQDRQYTSAADLARGVGEVE